MIKTFIFLFIFYSFSFYSQKWEWTHLTNTPEIYDTLIFSNYITKDNQGNLYKVQNGIKKYGKTNNLKWYIPSNSSITQIKCNRSLVYVNGFFIDSLNFGNNTLYKQGAHGFLASFDSLGNNVWLKLMPPPAIVEFGNILEDENQNTYFAIQFIGQFALDSNMFTPQNNWDILLLKLDQSGSLTWWEQLHGNNTEWCPKIGLDSFNNLYVSGTFLDSLYLGNFHFKSTYPCSGSSSTCGDLFLCKYSSTAQIQWAICGGQVGHDVITNMIVTPEGNTFLCSAFKDTLHFGSLTFPLSQYGFGNGPQSYIAKFDSNGAGAWGTHALSFNGNSIPDFISVYPDGTIFLQGHLDTVNTSYFIFGNDTIIPKGNRYTVSKLTDEDVQVSIQKNSKDNLILNVHPNPSNGQIFIICKKEKTHIKITDVLGVTLLEEELNMENKEMTLNANKGVYFLEAVTSDTRTTHKLIIN